MHVDLYPKSNHPPLHPSTIPSFPFQFLPFDTFSFCVFVYTIPFNQLVVCLPENALFCVSHAYSSFSIVTIHFLCLADGSHPSPSDRSSTSAGYGVPLSSVNGN